MRQAPRWSTSVSHPAKYHSAPIAQWPSGLNFLLILLPFIPVLNYTSILIQKSYQSLSILQIIFSTIAIHRLLCYICIRIEQEKYSTPTFYERKKHNAYLINGYHRLLKASNIDVGIIIATLFICKYYTNQKTEK